jgi:hypothetical protein
VPSGDEISFPIRKLSQKNYDNMLVTLIDKRPSYSTIKIWVARFRTEILTTEDEELSGRPTQVTVPENMDPIDSMILTIEEYPLHRKKIAEILAISRETVGYRIIFRRF